MFKISQGMEIERPAAVVWPYLAALEQVPLWEHGILDVKQNERAPPSGCGSRPGGSTRARLRTSTATSGSSRKGTSSLRPSGAVLMSSRS